MQQQTAISQISKPNIEYVLVACNTYKRPEMLKQYLESVKEMTLLQNIKVELLIVDNDIESSAKPVIKSLEKFPIKIHYFVEEKRGLSNARNRLLKEAVNLGASHIAICDDDDIVDKNWLLELVDLYNNHPEAKIISGPEYAYFVEKFPAYLKNNNIFIKKTTKKKGELKETCSTHNAFFPTEIMTKENIWFDPMYVFMGGEDGDFFYRAGSKGYKIAYNNEAIVREINDKNRVNVRWILHRNFYNGYSGAYLKFKNNRNTAGFLFYLLKMSIIVLIDIIFIPFSIIGGLTFFFNILGHTCKNIGKLSGGSLQKPLEYYKHLNGGIKN